MTATVEVDAPPPRGRAARTVEPSAARTRARLYAAGLVVALLLHLAVAGIGGGVGEVAAILAAVGLCLPLALAFPGRLPAHGLAVAAAALGAAAALAYPLGAALAGGAPVPSAVRSVTIWPAILVLLFASRMLAELCEMRFAAFWQSPLRAGAAPRTQSILAAAFLGTSLALVFYQLAGSVSVAPERLDPAAIAWRAFTGGTPIHVAIVVLFSTLLSAILDAALLTAGDGSVLAHVRTLCRGRLAAGATLTRADLRDLLASRLRPVSHSRTCAHLSEALRDGPGTGPAAGMAPIEIFHMASRRLLRALLAFLPLLGFLGTVIGLTAAIGGLPTEIGEAGSASLDISASLSGLAVKFETTLLGLAGGLVASLLLALIERREVELAAECGRLVEAVTDAG